MFTDFPNVKFVLDKLEKIYNGGLFVEYENLCSTDGWIQYSLDTLTDKEPVIWYIDNTDHWILCNNIFNIGFV